MRISDAALAEFKDKVKKSYMEAFAKEDGAFNSALIRKQVHDLLLKERRDIVVTLMGLDTSWSRLEVKRESPLRHAIDNVIKEEIDKLFAGEVIRKIFSGVVKSPTVLAAIKKSFAEVFDYEVRCAARKAAQTAAEEQSKKIVAEILNTEV